MSEWLINEMFINVHTSETYYVPLSSPGLAPDNYHNTSDRVHVSASNPVFAIPTSGNLKHI